MTTQQLKPLQDWTLMHELSTSLHSSQYAAFSEEWSLLREDMCLTVSKKAAACVRRLMAHMPPPAAAVPLWTVLNYVEQDPKLRKKLSRTPDTMIVHDARTPWGRVLDVMAAKPGYYYVFALCHYTIMATVDEEYDERMLEHLNKLIANKKRAYDDFHRTNVVMLIDAPLHYQVLQALPSELVNRFDVDAAAPVTFVLSNEFKAHVRGCLRNGSGKVASFLNLLDSEARKQRAFQPLRAIDEDFGHRDQIVHFGDNAEVGLFFALLIQAITEDDVEDDVEDDDALEVDDHERNERMRILACSLMFDMVHVAPGLVYHFASNLAASVDWPSPVARFELDVVALFALVQSNVFDPSVPSDLWPTCCHSWRLRIEYWSLFPHELQRTRFFMYFQVVRCAFGMRGPLLSTQCPAWYKRFGASGVLGLALHIGRLPSSAQIVILNEALFASVLIIFMQRCNGWCIAPFLLADSLRSAGFYDDLLALANRFDDHDAVMLIKARLHVSLNDNEARGVLVMACEKIETKLKAQEPWEIDVSLVYAAWDSQSANAVSCSALLEHLDMAVNALAKQVAQAKASVPGEMVSFKLACALVVMREILLGPRLTDESKQRMEHFANVLAQLMQIDCHPVAKTYLWFLRGDLFALAGDMTRADAALKVAIKNSAALNPLYGLGRLLHPMFYRRGDDAHIEDALALACSSMHGVDAVDDDSLMSTIECAAFIHRVCLKRLLRRQPTALRVAQLLLLTRFGQKFIDAERWRHRAWLWASFLVVLSHRANLSRFADVIKFGRRREASWCVEKDGTTRINDECFHELLAKSRFLAELFENPLNERVAMWLFVDGDSQDEVEAFKEYQEAMEVVHDWSAFLLNDTSAARGRVVESDSEDELDSFGEGVLAEYFASRSGGVSRDFDDVAAGSSNSGSGGGAQDAFDRNSLDSGAAAVDASIENEVLDLLSDPAMLRDEDVPPPPPLPTRPPPPPPPRCTLPPASPSSPPPPPPTLPPLRFERDDDRFMV